VTIIQGPGRQTDGYWSHTGKFVVSPTLVLQSGADGSASLVLPDGAITTQMIVPQACQQMIGSYVQLLSFTLAQSSVWTETPAQVTVSFGGNPVRVEFGFAVSCTVKGQHVGWGIMVDGAVPLVTLGGLDAPEANFGSMANGCFYVQPSASTHRIAIGLIGPAGSSIPNNVATTLYITEQKR